MAPFFEQPTSLLADMASLSPPRLSFYNLKIQVIDEERVIDDERPSPIRRLSEIPPLAPPPTNIIEKHHSISRSGKSGGFDKARRLPEPPLFLEEESSPPNYQYPRPAPFTSSKGLPPRRPLIHSDPTLCKKMPPARSPKRSVSMQVRATYHPVPQRRDQQVMLPRQAKRATSLMVAGSDTKTSPNTEDSINPTGLKRRSTSIHRPKDESEQPNGGISGEKDKFAPRRNKSIHAGFSKTLSKRRSIVEHHANDIWIECLYLKQNGNAVTHFKSLHGQEYRKEPPTGATTIIYLEDFVEREQDSVERKASTSASKKKHTKKEKRLGLKKKFKSFVSMVKPKKEFT